MATEAQIIDGYFKAKNFFPHVPFKPIGEMIVDVARNHTGSNNLWVSTAAALVEQESGGKNILGCDAGGLFCNEAVTPARVDQLKRHVNAGGASNGVGLTQITYFPFILEAEQMGGAHIMRNQAIVGFNVLNDLLNNYDYLNALEAYNDGNPRFNNPANPYEVQFAAKHAAWKKRLRAAQDGNEVEPVVPRKRKPAGVPSRITPNMGNRIGWNDNAWRLVKAVEAKFGVVCSTYDHHGTTGRPHGVDIWIAEMGATPSKAQEEFGDEIQRWVENNVANFNVHYIIWWNWMRYWNSNWFDYSPWSKPASQGGWPHGYADMDTRKHLDHIHVQVF